MLFKHFYSIYNIKALLFKELGTLAFPTGAVGRGLPGQPASVALGCQQQCALTCSYKPGDSFCHSDFRVMLLFTLSWWLSGHQEQLTHKSRVIQTL